jgi:hypothetical protein
VNTICDKCSKELSVLLFECNNLLLEEEDDALEKTDNNSEINGYSRHTAVETLKDL